MQSTAKIPTTHSFNLINYSVNPYPLLQSLLYALALPWAAWPSAGS